MTFPENKVEPIFKGVTQTKTEVFMKLLFKLYYLPATFNKEMNTVTYKFWSRQSIIHVLIYLILYLMLTNFHFSLVLTTEVVGKLMDTTSFVEFASFGTTFLTIAGIFMPILILKNADDVDFDSIKRYKF